ncbi:hypothetical protein [Chamaesiphon polymorphus]|uniref:hypothetical protein n=1 Tax=Chamaesiphon polymorphus TaxID=2107691 RepID=UPI0011B1F0D9|nr:hypothetical protein [Chamaesiphon polymorphus]NJR32612.1 hypothetical protein [Chamaesiphon sp. CSU_1_12]
MKSVYVLWSLVTGVGLLGVRTFGNPFSDRVDYRVEYSGKAGTTLWGSYTMTQNGRSRISTNQQAVGKLPLTINFSTGKNMTISANGSTANQEPITIKIYKHGSECSNSDRIDRAGVTTTVVCR